MATRTVTDVVTTTVTSATPSSTLRAPSQGGIFDGENPSVYNPSNPIIMFIIQAGIVITFCRLLHWPLSKMRQPRVIAEVIGGILLGPSVMGRIPGFTDAIFPVESMPNFSLVANLGLVLFLFLVGLEVDLRFLISNWQVALSVGAAGMALPFGLGCAISWGLYHEFRGDEGVVPISFGTYMLFIAIAMAITAFPVLCRILTELKLLSTPVGVIVLSAGVGNDVVGWILLALCVALVNASTGLTALWILLTALGYTLFLVFAFRPGFLWVLRRTRSLQDGPSQGVVALTLITALASAFFTGVIGIHPIFGAFVAGLICPHEGGFAIKVTEKVEDLVTALFLPLYFALSGLNTNLGLLDSGIAWAYVVGVIAVAFFAKVIGGSGAARLNGLVWRECFTIGALMSCKGLVELIVLNIGLQTKILSDRTFTIFVVMALVTTFATTPLVSWLYPPWYQKKLEMWKRGEIDWDTGRRLDGSDDDDDHSEDQVVIEKIQSEQMGKLLVYLRLDTMPSLLALTSLFGGSNDRLRDDKAKAAAAAAEEAPPKNKGAGRALEVHGVRLLQLTERESSVMQVSEAEEFSAFDPLVNTFRAFGRLHNVNVSGEVVIVPETYYADTLTSRAAEMTSDMLLLPWSETGSLSELQNLSSESLENKLSSGPYRGLVEEVVNNATCNTGVFVNQGFGGSTKFGPRRLSRTLSGLSMRSQPETFLPPLANKMHHVFVPFFGSADDRLAVRFVLQLARDSRLTVTIVYFQVPDEVAAELDLAREVSTPTVSPRANGKAHATSSSAEAIAMSDRNGAFLSTMRTSLPADIASRVSVESTKSSRAVSDVVNWASLEISRTPQNAGDLVVFGRNGARSGSSSPLGNIGDALVQSKIEASLLVVQSKRR